MLSKWFGTSRYAYNKAISLLNDEDTPTNFKGLVPVVFDELPDWHKETPRQIKVGAVMDACQAVGNAKVKCKQTGEFQTVKFRSRKNPRQTLYLRADSLKKNGFYLRFLGDMKMSEPLPAKPQGTGKVSERDTDAEVKDSHELHKKIAHFLVTNFDIILLPTFETKQMTKRGGRKLRSRTARQMLTLSHYRFKVFLKQKAKEYGVQVKDVCEAYTSKTVSWTGELVANLGGSKVIKSSEGQSMDRDLNGARGIFIKTVARALTVRPYLA